MTRYRRWGGLRAVCLAGLAGLAAQSCGYALAGRGNSLPAYVKTIGVPPFVNQSTLPDVDRVVTQAVQAEFQSRGRYRVVPDETGVDAVLHGTITSVTTRPSAFTADRQVSRYIVVVTAKVEFIDKHANDKVLWSNPSAQFQDEYPVTTGAATGDPSAFLRQDASALDRLAKNFARTIVTSILEAF
jgi:Lipopolysaccharide-assembly